MSYYKNKNNNVSDEIQDLSDDLIETDDLLKEETEDNIEDDLSFAPDPDIDSELLQNLLDEEEELSQSEPELREPMESPVESVTVITKGTTISGSIVSDCSLDVMGTINGDIECIGKLTITGNVVGNSVASEIYVNTKKLEGNLDCEGSIKIGLDTVIIGDIKAGSAVIAGAVKGEVDIKGPIVLDSTAIVKGNVKGKSVQMNNGAVLEGFCSLAYSSVDIENVFN